MKKTMTGVAGPRLRVLPLGVSLALAATSAQAVTFNIGEIEGRFDTSLSIGASWAMDSPDRAFIGTRNGGTASTQTSDDGRLNFKKGETFSKIFKGVHDLELKYGDTGVFVRGKYWYDFELKDEGRLLEDIDDNHRDMAAKSSGVELLDAFVYHNYTINDLPGTVRAGRQVVSWGESTFIQNGINSINPVDVSALRRPGSEVKEALIPVNMLYFNQGLTDSLSFEASYQLQWEKTVADNCGTFFSSDVVAKGCDNNMAINGSDFDRDVDGTGIPGGYGYVPRLSDKDPRNSGQFGVALRWMVPELNDTEFGVYAMNYHSRTPTSTWRVGRGALLDPVGGLAGQGGVSTARYYLEYPEDIRLYGLSFSTTVGATAVAGEISYRPNMPLSLNASDVSAAATLGAAATNPLVNAGLPVFQTGFASSAYGSLINGYVRKPFTQAQVTLTRTIDQLTFIGADRLTLVGEVGYSHIADLGATDGSDLRFGRSSVYGNGELSTAGSAPLLGGISGNNLCRQVANSANPDQCNSKGFYTADSWGYRVRAMLEYADLIGGVVLRPSVSFAHDVEGFGPTFNEGDKSVSIGVDAEYLNRYNLAISYTDYFGGDFNTNTDRDFLAVSLGVSF
ncbi:DUF1302 domain-containing protein [Pseudomonas taiwanensis]|uniref:DUF1302 domain-containing protein n=1 Tax=Pseudomonas taiwanensis TaxID=470150 RepID=A0ABR6V6B1_9PSED|nr:DUF1302 domain-containing protein [Pseudomonas taiwanensis]MBC3476038.1 DUF1302 domain-containing protein [Pseudomonas taiwanensis]MBC3490523.1 DUF1302 domain-containing protein [Pseudomonas taiwanensis]